MIPYERHKLILEHLEHVELLKIDELQALLPDVSISTLRRDLKEMEREGRIELLSGGAVKLCSVSHERGVQITGALHVEQKEEIARRAVAEVQDGDAIYIDSGSSGTILLRHLLDRDVTIYTANAAACCIQGETRARIIIIGGIFNAKTSSLTGAITEMILKDLYFDKAFLGVNAVSVERGIMNPGYEEAVKKRLVRQNSNVTYVLCDSSKFHQVSNVKVFDLEGVTLISNCSDDHLSKHVRILTPQE